MISATTKTRLGKALTDGRVDKGLLDSALHGGAMIVEREYIHEAPVNFGVLRQRIMTKKINNGYVVTTNATNNGRPYPLFIHEGTGKFKGMQQDFPSTGRVRSGESLRNRGTGGIRPNKFAKRAREKSIDRVLIFVANKLKVIE